MKQEIQLSDHFTYRKLLQFIILSIAMMIFTSIYGLGGVAALVTVFFMVRLRRKYGY